ncbi:sperm receptor for egg jelly-like [Branchiostoma floridae x Branchiostoma belcheri]
MAGFFLRFTVLLAVCIFFMDRCESTVDLELGICEPKARVGNKTYVIVDETMVSYSQATSTCASLGGRLASSRYRSYHLAYHNMMTYNKICYNGGSHLYFRPFWVDVVRDPGGAAVWRHGIDGVDVSSTEMDSIWYFNNEVSTYRDEPVDDLSKMCVRYMLSPNHWEVASCDEPAYFACEFDNEPDDGPHSPCFPTVVLDTGSRPYDAPFQLLRAGDFSTYGSIIHLDCPGDYNIAYKWRLRVAVYEDPTVLMDESYQLRNNDVILDDSSVFVPRNRLDLGYTKYLLELYVSVAHGGNSDVTTARVPIWIELEKSTPRFVILGGSRRSQSGGFLMDSWVDAEVYDDSALNGIGTAGFYGTEWSWTCRLPNGSDCGLQFRPREDRDHYNRVLYINHKVDTRPRWSEPGTYIIRVEWSDWNNVDYIPYEQEVTLFPAGFPTCQIRCTPFDNCNFAAAKFDQRLRLWTECTGMQPQHSYYWSLVQSPEGFVGVDLENNTLTGQDGDQLIVKANVFTEPGEYVLRLDILTHGVLCNTSSCSYAEWKFIIPVPPANAREPVCAANIPVPFSSVECDQTRPYSELNTSWTGEGCECREVSNLCTVSPMEGIALTTRFDMSCLDFEGQGAIRYEFYYRTRATASVSTLRTSQSGHYNLFYYGMSPSPRPFKLPSGLASDGFRVFIFVQMFDQTGTSKTSQLELTIRLPGAFEDLLAAIDATNAEVQQAIRWDNQMEAVHLSTITATTLNNIREEGAYEVVDWRLARQAIIYNVGRVPIEKIESVIQSAESLIQATHYDDEVPADAQTNAAGQLYNMAKFVARKVDQGEVTQDLLERVAGIVFTAAYNVFKSSEVVAAWKHTGNGPTEIDTNMAETLLKNRNATTTAFLAIDELTDQILKGKRPREDVTMISSQDFQIAINRTDCRTWFNDVNHTVHFTDIEEGTWFRLPPLPVILRAYARSALTRHLPP